MIKPKITNPPGKRGAPVGHKSATRVLGDPDDIIHVIVERWLECSYSFGAPLRTGKRIIFDIPPMQNVKETEYDLDAYKCSNCGSEVKSVHRNYSHTCDMGNYLVNYIVKLR